ncbi:DUF4886 domain-containing protein [Sedimentibacter hydroxybenzoicus DSM 7310]|uniref:DUF4886 domain-containing protein n=1 Tax=Sedimentibacter hydroxybenzoicus DSM 7310 TaxID=1123245 RepID=A0A974BLU7_SEDHY|nr:DUF4886 domain-containing protein [Sedimentibacter hydroxybenzoicus]NYB75764.1 DUF4886 domain-containing protein [Sedimentibacter hydroxybenzoicus DSM 7310]
MKKITLILLIIAFLFLNTVTSYSYATVNTIETTTTEEAQINQFRVLTVKIVNILNNMLDTRYVPSEKAIKILSVGNSFSQDSVYYLYEIAKAADVNIIVGNLYNSGCSLERHLKYANSDEKAYTYYKWNSKGMREYKNKTMKDAILDEDWDYITLQQASGESGVYDTFQPYLDELIDYIKELSTNTDLKLAFNMTWAYASKSPNNNFSYYKRNQITMYNSIVDAYKQASDETGIDIIIPCGTAIQNARNNKYLKTSANELTSDGYHLGYGLGRYIAGLTFFQTIIVDNEKIDISLSKDVAFFPDTKDCTEELASLAKKAALNAVKKPFEITK